MSSSSSSVGAAAAGSCAKSRLARTPPAPVPPPLAPVSVDRTAMGMTVGASSVCSRQATPPPC
eukprot:727500-Pyramimonas_sp.AAC.1